MQGFKTLIMALVMVVAALFVNDAADAAEVYKKTTDIISGPTIANNKATFTVGGNVKLIRHAKALNSNFSPTDVTGGTKTPTRITKFEYNCPGYYTTRVYSDVNGTQLIGYIQVYISDTDIKRSSCDTITPPPAPTQSKPQPIPPAPSQTHPDPIKTETLTPAPQPTPQKYETVIVEEAPPVEEIPPTPAEPEPMTWDQYCTNLDAQVYADTGVQYKHKPMPQAAAGEVYAPCCPIAEHSGSAYTIFNVANLKSSNYYALSDWYGQSLEVGDWRCGVLHVDIEDTYCAANQIYDRATNQCKVSSDTNRLSYTQPLYGESVSALEDHLEDDPPDETTEPPETEEPTPPEVTAPPPPPRDPNLVYDVFVAKVCKLDSGDYAVVIGPSGIPDADLHGLSRSTREDNYYLNTDFSSVFSDDTINGNYIIKKDAPNFELQFFRDNSGHGTSGSKLLATDVITRNDFNGAVNCMFEGGATGGNESPDPLPQQPQEPAAPDCEVEIWHEDCLPSCYCPTLDAYMPGLGFMCCVWECPGLDAIIQDGKNFLADDLVGTATPPPVPEFTAGEIPNIFDVLNDVDKNIPAPITTTEDPQLGDATFDANDIKMNAEEMPVRDDPTGGFDIKNPLDTLPADGSTAPRPDSLNEQIQYPQQSSGGGNINGNISYPQSNSGSVSTPSGGGSATPPGYSDQVQYPGVGG